MLFLDLTILITLPSINWSIH